ncbi:VQ motif-containing protein 1-like [Gastrolobium bilobum]|uniref:VQ motif-containing protein 1-like n=1 Tax=Gastrolobium bilobum TaxID=150636 RepID=UPI002AB1EE3E|nr:VQ motif-containing protein 1-like [Gastrolobium bilobum]
MSSVGCNRGPVKIVIINTQYVETDATSFKSVVQKLTGKDSDPLASEAEGKAQRERHKRHGVEVPDAVSDLRRSSFLMRDVSFKEFERLLNEMPPLNELI